MTWKKIWYLHRIVVTVTGVRCLTVRVTTAGAHVVPCFGRVNVSTVECKQTHATIFCEGDWRLKIAFASYLLQVSM
jgi:hypothetical protein